MRRLAFLITLALAMPSATASANLDRLIAPPRACPGQNRLGAPVRAQERTMRCMTNFARGRAGKPALAADRLLDRSARFKSRDMLRCDEFDHEACGRDFTFWIRRVGYLHGACWQAAENIALGTGPYGTVRAIFRGWAHSPGHLHNILGPSQDLGVGLQIGNLAGYRGAHVWTQHFGARC